LKGSNFKESFSKLDVYKELYYLVYIERMILLHTNKSGSMVELVMVLMFMVLFCVTMYTMIFVGTQTQYKLITEKDQQIDARIALSYINVKIKQNDIEDKITLKSLDYNGKLALVIRERGVLGDYDLWIYFSDGKIREEVSPVDSQPINSNFSDIIKTHDFDIYEDSTGMLVTSIVYEYNDKLETMTNKISLRSGKLDFSE
jgi:hypothetical protein